MRSQFFPLVPPLNAQAMEEARARWATRAMPPGALGRLQDMAVHLAGIAGVCPPPAPRRPVVVVFAGDHGVVADGASAWPAEVTAAMVATVSSGGAAISVFADAAVGIRIATEQIEAGADCLTGGDLGIGNTTAAAALIGAFTGRLAEEVTGHGAGVPAGRLDHKRRLVASAIRRAADCMDPLDKLAAAGGLEIAALAGLFIAAAQHRVPYIADGVIAGAALCAANALAPGTASHTIAGHLSSEPAASIVLDYLALNPLLDLDLRLGEGTGACLAFPLVQAAVRALSDMADLPGTPKPIR